MPNTSESDFLVTVAGIDGFFATCTGGNTPVDTSQAFNGGDPFPTIVVGKIKPAPITVGRPFDPARDQPLAKELRRRIGQFRTTVSSQPLLPDGSVIADPDVYPNALLTDVHTPDANAGSANPGVLQLVFGVERVI